jgi:hypothetical protein
MTIREAISELRSLNEPVPKPMRLPSPEEVSMAERRIGVTFHPDYRAYLLQASDVAFGTKEPATITIPQSRNDLFQICDAAWERMGVPKDLPPFCEDNGDYYCMAGSGEIVFWSHDGRSNERWPNLATWIEEVWIGESV